MESEKFEIGKIKFVEKIWNRIKIEIEKIFCYVVNKNCLFVGVGGHDPSKSKPPLSFLFSFLIDRKIKNSKFGCG